MAEEYDEMQQGEGEEGDGSGIAGPGAPTPLSALEVSHHSNLHLHPFLRV